MRCRLVLSTSAFVDAMRCRLVLSTFAFVCAGLAVRATAQEFTDPAPPEVTPQGAEETSPAEDFDGLRRHAAPRALAASAVVEDWPAFMGPRRDGRSRETPLRSGWGDEGPPVVWEMDRGEGYAAPAVAGTQIVFTHRVGGSVHVDCLHAETGRRHWRRSFDTDYFSQYSNNHGPRAAPTIHQGRVFVLGPNGRLSCLGLATGALRWQRDLVREFSVPESFFGVASSPIVHGDHLIVNLGAEGGPTVAAFDLATGALQWGCGREWGASYASPMIASARGRELLFVLTGGQSRPPTGGLMVIDPADGTVLDETPFRSRTTNSVNAATPVVTGDRVFLTASYGVGTKAYSIDAEGQLELAWSDRSLGIRFQTPLFVGGELVGVHGSSRASALVQLDPTDGRELHHTDLVWDEQLELGSRTTTATMSVGEASLLHADGAFLCLGEQGHLLRIVTTDEGAEITDRCWAFRARESWTPPVLSHGLLYLCQNTAEHTTDTPHEPRLICYDLRGE